MQTDLEKTGTFAQDEMVGALRALGADYVFDVTFSADLTIMEEGSELLSRILKGTGPLPQFTSCCPAWVKYMENFHPDKTAHLSSAKSPIGMQGAVIKTYFAHKNTLTRKRLFLWQLPLVLPKRQKSQERSYVMQESFLI